MRTCRKLAAICILSVVSHVANAGVNYVYVGKFAVADGPLWTTNPVTYTGQEAAAHIFGGNASDYAISTNGSGNASSITFSAYVDGWGVNYQGGPRIETTQNFKAGKNYNDNPGVVGSAYSAYVFDHACGTPYCAPGGGESAINHVWRIQQTPGISDQTVSALNTLLSTLDATKEGWINAIIDFKNGHGVGALKNFLVNIEPSVSGALTRVGGVLMNGLQGLLDADVTKGVKALYEQWKDPDHILNENERRMLRQIDCMENPSSCGVQPKPLAPAQQNGNLSVFKTYVNEKQTLTIDPELATGFEYSSINGGPKFTSIITPQLGEFQEDYGVQIKINDVWTTIGRATPLNEFIFSTPVDAFRIIDISNLANIDPSLHPTWISALSFDRAGEFTGQMRALTEVTNEVPEPNSGALFATSLVILFTFSRLRKCKRMHPLNQSQG